MRTLTATAAVIAAALVFGAQPGIAGENAVNESRAKIDRILSYQDGTADNAMAKDRDVTASTTLRKTMPRDRYELAHYRLFKSRSGPSGR